MQPTKMGRASEILQKPAPKVIPSAAPIPTPAPPQNPYSQVPLSSQESRPPILPSEIDDAPLVPPEAKFLEMLPDTDLDALCEKHLGRSDGRWGRRRKIDELLSAGITGETAVNSPPPPPIS